MTAFYHLQSLLAALTGRCPGRLNKIPCTLLLGHGGRHRGKAGKRGWPVEWQ